MALDDGGQHHVGRCADERSRPSDICRIGNAQHQAERKIAKAGAVFLVAVALFHQVNHRGANRQHHQGSGRVAHPHTDKRSGQQKAPDDAVGRLTKITNELQGKTKMQARLFHANGNQKTAQK